MYEYSFDVWVPAVKHVFRIFLHHHACDFVCNFRGVWIRYRLDREDWHGVLPVAQHEGVSKFSRPCCTMSVVKKSKLVFAEVVASEIINNRRPATYRKPKLSVDTD